MEMDESREGVDWHRYGADVPYWAVVLAIVLFLLLLASVAGLILGLS